MDADKISRELLKEPAVIEEIVGRFGRSVLDSNLQIDRTSLAALVFGNSDPQRSNREALERILHPRVRARLNDQVEASKSDPSTRLIVLDIPLLFEVGWNDACQGSSLLIRLTRFAGNELHNAAGHWKTGNFAKTPKCHSRKSGAFRPGWSKTMETSINFRGESMNSWKPQGSNCS